MNIRINIENVLYCLAALAIMTTSGANWSIVFLAVVALLTFVYGRKADPRLGMTALVLSVLLFLNSKIFSVAAFDKKEFAVFLIRFWGLAIIGSYINYEKFMRYYVQILYFIFCLTIPLWFINIVFNNVGLGNLIPGNFFDLFMMSHEDRMVRLRAIFWEGGVCGIQANIGLTYCICKGLNKKDIKRKAVVFLLAIVASVSSTAYIVLALQMLLYFIKSSNGIRTKTKVVKLFCLMFLLLVIEEGVFGVVLGKLLGGQSSFTSRYDDTLLALLIAKDHFWTGVGVAVDSHSVFLDYVHNNPVYLALRKYFTDDMASSNGLGNCMYKAGVPFTIAYLICIYRTIHKRMKLSIMESFIILAMYMCFFFGEPIMSVPFMLMFFYPISVREKGERKYNNESAM